MTRRVMAPLGSLGAQLEHKGQEVEACWPWLVPSDSSLTCVSLLHHALGSRVDPAAGRTSEAMRQIKLSS